jgi:monoamine oxidase
MLENTMPAIANTRDVVIVGAGAAGVAAARHLAAAGLEILVVEARDRVGGRAWTVPTSVGVPVDLGCEWLHSADHNPWTGIARDLGFAVDETLPDWGRRVTWHAGAAAERDWAAARDALDERYEAAAKAAVDQPASALLPPGGRWNGLLDAVSTWANGTELARVSVKDRERYSNSALNWRVLAGYGTLITAYAKGLPLQLDTIVERIDHSGRVATVHTSRGAIAARAVIVTVSTNLLAAEAIHFDPPVLRHIAAAAGLPLGIANKVYLHVDGAVDALPQDCHLVGRTDRVDTGNYQVRPHGWPIIEAYFGGALATRLDAAGAAAMRAFAIDELAGMFGGDLRKRLTPLASSAWVADPFARGSYSCALPGHADDRAVLAAPVSDRLCFAGEACSIEYFGTAHGAFLSGVAAADKIIAMLAAAKSAPL